MKKVLILLMLAFQFSAFAQNFTYEWSRVEMNDSWGKDSLANIVEIMDKYAPGMEPLMLVVASSSEDLTKKAPESGLSNLAADIIADAALPFVKKGDRIASITNFGGIRSDLPKGEIRVYDIFSVFPFNNNIVIVDILGSDLRKIYTKFVESGRFEALGGVRMVIDDKKMLECEVAGEPLEDDRIYKLSTIDFLLDGGDSMDIKKYAKSILRTDVVLRDIVVDYMKKKSAEGYVFDNKIDNRLNFK